MTNTELEKLVVAKLRKFGIADAKLGSCFEYDYENDIITFTTKKDFTDELFSTFLLDRFDYEDKYPFTMSLLHELGHRENNDDIENDVYAFCIGEKYKIHNDIFNTDDDDRLKILYYRYFSLPDELMATAWAVNYVNSHKKEVKELEKIFQKAIKEYNGFQAEGQ